MTKKDTYSYKGWLQSDRFLKRAFAIFGYQLVAGLIIQTVLMIIFLVFFVPFIIIAAFV